jgi:hypothetical protein
MQRVKLAEQKPDSALSTFFTSPIAHRPSFPYYLQSFITIFLSWPRHPRQPSQSRHPVLRVLFNLSSNHHASKCPNPNIPLYAKTVPPLCGEEEEDKLQSQIWMATIVSTASTPSSFDLMIRYLCACQYCWQLSRGNRGLLTCAGVITVRVTAPSILAFLPPVPPPLQTQNPRQRRQPSRHDRSPP